MKTACNYRRDCVIHSLRKNMDAAECVGIYDPTFHIQVESLVRHGVKRNIAVAYYNYKKRKNAQRDANPV